MKCGRRRPDTFSRLTGVKPYRLFRVVVEQGDGCSRAEPRGSSIDYPVSERSSVGTLSRIEEVKRWDVIPHRAWMIEVP